MMNYIFAVLQPLSNGILLDFLAGNLPACFMQLRTLIEQLAKCFNADTQFPEESFFQDRLKKLEKKMVMEKSSLWKLVESLGGDIAPIWGQLSEYWIHMRGFRRIVDAVTARGVPSYALVLPMTYDDTEGPDIAELGQSIRHFRTVLDLTIQSWKSQNPQLS